MNKRVLIDTIGKLFAGNKGLLAMDESNGTCNKRFAAAGIPQTIEMRRNYRELIVTTLSFPIFALAMALISKENEKDKQLRTLTLTSLAAIFVVVLLLAFVDFIARTATP